MLPKVFAAIVLFLAIPNIAVKWKSEGHDSITVVGGPPSEELVQCLQAGFAVRYRFNLQLCKNRPGWFASCEDTRTVLQTLDYDAVSETYRLVTDFMSDKVEPNENRISSLAEGLAGVMQIPSISLQDLGGPAGGVTGEKPMYVAVRLTTDCRGSYNRTIRRIGYLLTFGLLSQHEFDTGWLTFTLDPKERG